MGAPMRGAEPQVTAKIIAGFDDFLRRYPGLNFGLVNLLVELELDLVQIAQTERLPLNKLAELRNKNLLSQSEYDAKRQNILDEI